MKNSDYIYNIHSDTKHNDIIHLPCNNLTVASFCQICILASRKLQRIFFKTVIYVFYFIQQMLGSLLVSKLTNQIVQNIIKQFIRIFCNIHTINHIFSSFLPKLFEHPLRIRLLFVALTFQCPYILKAGA